MSTEPNKKTLAGIRRHVGKVNTRAHVAVATLIDSSRKLPEVIEAVRELAHAPTEQADVTVTALLFASHDRRPEVREVAARAMPVHPYGLILARLSELAEDPSAPVRAAALKAYEEMSAVTPPCLSCGGTGYDPSKAVRAPPPTDPHAVFLEWPLFCSARCAVHYACDRAQALANEETLHACLVTREWRHTSEADCDHCQAADLPGR